MAPSLKEDSRTGSSELAIVRFQGTTSVSPSQISKKMMATVRRTVQLTALYANPAAAR